MNTDDAHELCAGDLRAVFLPGRGMLGSSLRHRGDELLGRVDDIEALARAGKVCGIPLLHPWANRLAGSRYVIAGREVSLEASTSIGRDSRGLPMHGVPWSRQVWHVLDATTSGLRGRLRWASAEQLAVFPFPHTIELDVELGPRALTIRTVLRADESSVVPVSFGFHPYLRIPGLPRSEWHVELPSMERLVLDDHQIPDGRRALAHAVDEQLGTSGFDDGFALLDPTATFSVQGNRRRLTVDLVEGYGFAQVFAPPDSDYLAFEPMAAPANALISGSGLRLLEPGEAFRASFRIGIEEVEV